MFWRPKPYADAQGWEKMEQGILEPVWSIGHIFPPSLINLLEKADCEDEEDEEADEDIDYDDMFDDDNDDDDE
jgi:hypothetical protein